MVMFLQIVLLLLLISLAAILIGYLIGKLYCKSNEDSIIVKKGVICEDNYYQKLIEINQEDDTNIKKDDFIPNDSVSVEDSQSNNSTNITHIDSSKIKEQENQKESQADKSKEEIIKPSTQDNNLEDETINKTNLENSKQNISNNENEAYTTKEDKKDNINHNKPKEISKDQEKTKSNDSSSNTKNEHDTNEDKTSKDIKNEDNIKEDSIKPSLLLDKPKEGKADNLTKIKGVGKVIEEKLNNLGIYHFEQIASLTNEEIKWLDEHLAFKGRILRENWIEQAKILAKGEETEFSKRVEKGEVETSKKSD